jgi:hypothetical protein
MNNIKRARVLALAVAATALMGFTQAAPAQPTTEPAATPAAATPSAPQSVATGPAIDVVVSRKSDGNTLNAADPTNLGVTPTTYTPALMTIAPAAGVKYDAADTSDPGTQWNTLLAPPPAVIKNDTGDVETITLQKDLPLMDSTGAATQVKLNVLYLESANKANGIHNAGLSNSASTGADGLEANPKELTRPSWVTGGSADQIEFQLTGLTPNGAFDLYIYGAGKNGNGATFSLPNANQGVGFNSANGAYTSESTKGSAYFSVFASGGTDPKPEEGKSWIILPAQADAGGNLAFFVEHQHGTKIKGSINGFQLQPVDGSSRKAAATSGPAATTEPATEPGMNP